MAKKESITITGNLTGYLYTSVRNRIFNIFAHQKVASGYLLSLNEYLKSHVSTPTDHRIREKELKAYIEKEISALPPKMRLIFELSRKENLSHKEIAHQLNISENNVSKQVNNALRVLRTKLGLLIYIYFLIRF